jgi:hypothetical protein
VLLQCEKAHAQWRCEPSQLLASADDRNADFRSLFASSDKTVVVGIIPKTADGISPPGAQFGDPHVRLDQADVSRLDFFLVF